MRRTDTFIDEMARNKCLAKRDLPSSAAEF
jgi:hypothetical protein